MVTPALDQYTQDRLLGDVWKRPGLSSRDRSIITLSALIARSQTIEMPYHFNLALDNGVKPREISEIITHLAFYAGWANAMSAVAVAKDVFAERKIGSDQLPAVTPAPLPLDEVWETQRATRVREQFGAAFPGIGPLRKNWLPPVTRRLASVATSPMRLRWRPWSSRRSLRSGGWMRRSTMPACRLPRATWRMKPPRNSIA
jgi:alkylhydroperoxidase/carboxymuconolactone decarboxylase family protein YurZ